MNFLPRKASDTSDRKTTVDFIKLSLTALLFLPEIYFKKDLGPNGAGKLYHSERISFLGNYPVTTAELGLICLLIFGVHDNSGGKPAHHGYN